MSSNPEQIKADIEVTRAGLSKNVDALAETIRPGNMAARQKDKITAAVFGSTDKATSAVFGAKDTVLDTVDQAQSSTGEALSAVPQVARQSAQGNPLAAGLIAVGIGWLAGSLLPATRVERRAADTLKEKTAPVVEEVSEMAKRSAQNLQEPAKEALAEVKSTGVEAVQTLKEEASSTLSDVTDTAKEGAASVQQASASN
ncbi:MAG: DUF3618 domain-containing protein [Actinomycetota bacterium]